MRREDEQNGGQISKRMFNLKTEIASYAAGPAGITKITYKYQGQPVTQVPAGSQFDIFVDWFCENVAGGLNTWTACITCMALDKSIKDFVTVSTGLVPRNRLEATSELEHYKPHVMPNHDITFRFKLWANDTYNMTTPPAESVWV